MKKAKANVKKKSITVFQLLLPKFLVFLLKISASGS